MNILEVLKNKQSILDLDKSATCPKCMEDYSSVFDRLYLAAKEKCYICDPDENLANNILNNL